jgi:hypothetical protein
VAKTIAEEYAEGLVAMGLFHSPSVLRRAAEEVLEHLPDGPVSLVSTSMEGAALAALCSVMAERQVSGWHLVDVTFPIRAELERQVIVIEPVDPGEGWRSMVHERLPRAQVVIPAPSAG